MPDQLFEDAICSLETSTTAIEKQCRLLEGQRRALQKIKQRSARAVGPNDSTSQHENKVNRERSSVEYESSELANALQTKLSTSAKAGFPTSSRSQPDVERILEKDDRLLDGLEKILAHLADNDGDGRSSEDVARLCHSLKHFTSADIRAKVDAAYLDGMQQYARNSNGVNGKPSKESQQLASLNAELSELCREIDGLSTMAADNQYRNPLLHAINVAKSDSEAENTAWAEYLYTTIQFSASRVDYLLEQSDEQRAHGNVTRAMSIALEEILAAGIENHEEGQGASQSPSKIAQKGLKPLRLVQANFSDAQDPASQLCRQLDVRISGEIDTPALNTATADKFEKFSALRANTEQSISAQLAHSLTEAEKDVQQLLTATLMHCPYSSIHLESDAIRTGTDGLESKTQDLSERMRILDIDAIMRAAHGKQEELMDHLSQRY